MAKLSKEKAAAVNAAEGQSFEPIPGGRYVVELLEVKTDGKGPAGPYWQWILKVVETGQGHAGRRLYLTTSLSQDWAIKAAFDAFGKTADDDTDDFLTELAACNVSVREIQDGPKKGQMSNNVDAIFQVTEEDMAAVAAAPEGGSSDGGEDDEDPF